MASFDTKLDVNNNLFTGPPGFDVINKKNSSGKTNCLNPEVMNSRIL